MTSVMPLPPLLEEIAEIAGLGAALKIAVAKGGQRVSIPGQVKDDHWLVDLLGKDTAITLSAYFTDGNTVYLDIPFGPAKASHRLARTKALLDKKLSANEIAAHEGITRRTVFNRKRALQSADKDAASSDQLSLFKLKG